MSGATPPAERVTDPAQRVKIPTQRSNMPADGVGMAAPAADVSVGRRFDLALIVLILGAALRVWSWARGRSLWLDEQMIAMNIRDRDLLHLSGKLDHEQSAPLGWLWAEKIATLVLGEGERALRLQPLLFGLATLVVAWWIGRRWFGPIGAAVLVALFAVGPTMIAYADELKHYSADLFWVLVLLALAARILQDPQSRSKVLQFWLIAAVGLWFGMGPFLVAPGLALVMIGQAWTRHGWRTAFTHVVPGIAFTVSFAAHYLLSLRLTTQSDYLATYWSGIGYPSEGSGIRGVANWFVAALARLSDSPLDLWDLASAGVAFRVSAVVTIAFWCLVAAGIIIIAATRRLEFGLLLAAPLLSGLIFALLHLVPLAVRLALWLVPALYLAVAVAVSAATRALPQAWRHRNDSTWPRTRAMLTSIAAAIALAFPMALVPMTQQSLRNVFGEPDLDDRAAISWMQEQHRPGDLVLLVSSATRAAQWYDPDGRLSPFQVVLSTRPDRIVIRVLSVRRSTDTAG